MTTDQAQARPVDAALPSWPPYAALVVGVFAVSTAAIFIRLAQADGAPSLVLAAARMSVAALALTPAALLRHRAELRRIALDDLKWALVAGLVLGVHFATWISSLEYTSVVNSVTLVTTAPLWVALASPLVLKESISRRAAIGIALALAGGVVVGLSGDAGAPPTRHDPLLGNGLALVGAWAAAIYFMLGRRLRARLSVVLYTWLVYGTAAILLVIAVIVGGLQVSGFPADTYLWMVLLGLVPQLIGHSSLNFALGYFPAAYVSLTVLGEPIGSGLLAIVFLAEWPVPLQLAGAVLVLIGIALATLERPLEKRAGPR